LQHIRELLDKHYQGVEALTANQDLIRALHTLFGSARTAEVDEIAELCGALEKYVKLYQEEDDLTIVDDGVKVIDDVSVKVSAMLKMLADPEKRLQTDQVLLDRINALSDELKNKLESDIQSVEEPQIHEPGSVQKQEKISDSESLVS
jgi:chemosensory pili system protein ChpA (sensor histidine kinase/response regulator)